MAGLSAEHYQRGSKPVIRHDGVWKEYCVDWKIEHEKAIALWNLSLKEDFIVPRPLALYDQTRTIVYEHVAYSVGVRERYIEYMKDHNPNKKDLKIFFKIGEILAKVHCGLSLSSRRLWQPSEEFQNCMTAMGCDNFMAFCEQSPHAFFHCDYSFANLYVEGENDNPTIVLLDPSPNYHTTFFPDTYGTIYIDIGVFLASLNGRIPVRFYPWIKWGRLREVKQAFLAGYEQTSGIRIEISWAERFGYAVARSYFRSKYHSSFMRRIATFMLYNKLKNNSIKEF